jgi:hypothetical protein
MAQYTHQFFLELYRYGTFAITVNNYKLWTSLRSLDANPNVRLLTECYRYKSSLANGIKLI